MTITISGLNSGSYNPVTATANITVNKLDISLSAKCVSIVYGNSGNIIVTLKDSNNKVLDGMMLVLLLTVKHIIGLPTVMVRLF